MTLAQSTNAPGVVCHFTFLYNVRTAFLFHVCFVGEPLDAFAKGVHVRILEYVDGHDDLVVSRYRVTHVVVEKDSFLTTNARWPDVSARHRIPQDMRSGLHGWCRQCICKPSGYPQSNIQWLERAHLCHGQIPVLLHDVVKPD